jgi:hypothetical protein
MTPHVPKTISQYLTDNHTWLHALLSAADYDGHFDGDAFEVFRANMLRHIGIEEKLLLPAVRRIRGEPIARARALRVEHAALTSLLVPTPDLALCREIAALLAAHDAQEEGDEGVYAECEQLLGSERSRALAEQAVHFPAVPVVAHFDGPGTYRTAPLALAAASRIKLTKHQQVER